MFYIALKMILKLSKSVFAWIHVQLCDRGIYMSHIDHNLRIFSLEVISEIVNAIDQTTERALLLFPPPRRLIKLLTNNCETETEISIRKIKNFTAFRFIILIQNWVFILFKYFKFLMKIRRTLAHCFLIMQLIFRT